MGFGPAAWVYGSEVRTSPYPPHWIRQLTYDDIDLPDLGAGPGTQLLCIGRRHRVYRRGTGLACWHREHWIAHIFLLLRCERRLHPRTSTTSYTLCFTLVLNLVTDHLRFLSRDEGACPGGHGCAVPTGVCWNRQ